MRALTFYLACVSSCLAAGLPAAETPDYHVDIVPILRDYCVGCHNESDYDGDFSVETYGALMKGSGTGPVIEPGKPADSFLLHLLHRKDEPFMPPEKEPQPAAEHLAKLEAWIAAGAVGPDPEADASMLASLQVPELPASEAVALPVTAAAVAPETSRMALARFGQVDLLEIESETIVHQFRQLEGKVNGLEFSPDGRHLVAAGGIAGLKGTAVLWDCASGEVIRRFEGHGDVLYDAAFSPDGTLLATAGYDRLIRLWNVESGEMTMEIDGHNGAVFDLAFSPDGTLLASASADETAKIWKVATGERLDTLNQPQGEQNCVAFTPDGAHVLAAGADNRVRLWQLVSKEAAQINPLIHACFGHEAGIVDLVVGQDNRWAATASADATVKIWSLPDLQPITVFPDQPDIVASMVERPGGRLLVTRLDGSRSSYPIPAAPSDPSAEIGGDDDGDRLTEREETTAVVEIEEDMTAEEPQEVSLPARIRGTIETGADRDTYRIAARQGEEWVFEVDAARSGSPLDSFIEIRDAADEPVERVVLQALRDSWFTFRGKDSGTSDDFRLQNWLEMELNEYLYANGEVVKLWHYPRGPDSGFKVYPGFGARHTYFGTTALSHALGAPCYIVQPLPPGSAPAANGLPVFHLYYENDDDPQRHWGSDSRLLFTAPADGDYLVRIRDVRGFGGEDFRYALTIRPRMPDFTVAIDGKNPALSPGSGKEVGFTATRLDAFDGEIRIDIEDLPPGFTASTPVVIEEGQLRAFAVIHAAADAMPPEGEAIGTVTATATIRGERVEKALGDLGKLTLGPQAKVIVAIEPDTEGSAVSARDDEPLVFTIRPGETITARVQAKRVDFDGRIELGGDDSGRNLPHGVYVDNIGLNGLLIVEGQDSRQFFITAAAWVPPSERLFFLRTTADGVQASRPALLRVVPREGVGF